MNEHYDYYDAGFHIFGLYGVVNGVCECGNPRCEALFKHPRVSSWQHTPFWGEEQFDAMNEYGQFDTGFGVLCNGYLVIDIDPRNGGSASYEKLVLDTSIDFKKDAGFVVFTGGSGWHIYYKYDGEKLAGALPLYPGIDFKTSGFVVGSGSLHNSGMAYETENGSPDNITDAPALLVEMLKKKAANVSDSFNPTLDKLTPEKVAELLTFIDCEEYEQWVQMGMICNDELGDAGFQVWDRWSQTSDKYDPAQMEFKWHSFGKSSSRITVGTLIRLAKNGGYSEPVTFETSLTAPPVEPDIDLYSPPGLVGDCVEYINSCSRFPRKSLAVSAALMAVSSIGGLRFEDEQYGVTPNLFTFNVAGSATGKEAIQQAHSELLICAGLGATVYGTIKSEQEIYRNIGRHQAANYLIDEFGILLSKIKNGSTGGSASYLGGVIGSLMSIYSKANGKLLLGADHAEDLRQVFRKRISKLMELKDSNEIKPHQLSELESLDRIHWQLVDGYIESPFLSLSGYTTPSTFNGLVTYSEATNGFIGRAILFEEKNNNPKSKKGFRKPSRVPDFIAMRLKSLFNGGNAEIMRGGRIEFNGSSSVISTDDKAIELLEVIEGDLQEQAGLQMETSGLEAIVRRSFELVLKLSMVLAMGDGGVRTSEHVKWAYALVQRDIENKINLTSGNMAEDEKNLSGEVLAKVRHKLDKEEGQTAGSIKNKMRKISKENVQAALDYLVGQKTARCEETKPVRGPAAKMYFLA